MEFFSTGAAPCLTWRGAVAQDLRRCGRDADRQADAARRRAPGHRQRVAVDRSGQGPLREPDYQRYAKPYGVPLIVNPHFPIVTLHLMRVATGVQLRAPERFQKFLAATDPATDWAPTTRRRTRWHAALKIRVTPHRSGAVGR